MTKYKCNDCKNISDETEIKEVNTTYESYYGVSHLFNNSNPLTLCLCPHCDSEDIEEVDDCGDDE